MKILTKTIEKKLQKNFQNVKLALDNGEDIPCNQIPVLKLFGGSVDILIEYIDFENDVCFGIFDLGLGSCELGSNRWSEILQLCDRRKYPLRALERERDFVTNKVTYECLELIQKVGWQKFNN